MVIAAGNNGRGVLLCSWALPVLLAVQSPGAAAAPAQWDQPDLARYGEILEPSVAHPEVGRAYQVFERVRAVAGQPRRIRLVVVRGQGNAPWAMARPDGIVVLSLAGIAVALATADSVAQDARLAFILGHEMAHVVRRDGDNGGGEGLAPGPGGGDAAALAVARQNEARADAEGFVYAAVAGFDVASLAGDGRQEDFFSQWMRQTRIPEGPTHPPAAARAEQLRQSLHTLAGRIPFYYAGIGLAQTGRCREARFFLEKINAVFPSREVLAGIGHCLFLEARQGFGTQALPYWLPLPLDPETRAAALTATRGEGRPTPAALEALREARETLDLALRADPAYRPARFTAIAAALQAGESFAARTLVEEGLRHAPGDFDLQALGVLCDYRVGADRAARARAFRRLARLAADGKASAGLSYNVALLAEERGDRKQARNHWQSLRGRLARLPRPYRQTACARLAIPCPNATMAAVALGLPVTLGEDLLARGREGERRLAGWEAVPFEAGDIYGTLYYRRGQGLVLALRGYVELLMAEGEAVAAFPAAVCGETAKADGEALRPCGGGFAWVAGERIGRLWRVRGAEAP